MTTYRIFVQDRPRGKYSGLTERRAMSRENAVRACGDYPVKLKAIPWPATTATDKDWLKRYVG